MILRAPVCSLVSVCIIQSLVATPHQSSPVTVGAMWMIERHSDVWQLLLWLMIRVCRSRCLELAGARA